MSDLHALSGTRAGAPATGRSATRPTRSASRRPPRPAAGPHRREPALPAAADTKVSSAQGDYVRPDGLRAALELFAARPDARLVAGSTGTGGRAQHQGTRGLRDHRHRAVRVSRGSSPSARPHQPKWLEPVGDRVPARRPGAAACRPVPAVRVAADPQRGFTRSVATRHRPPIDIVPLAVRAGRLLVLALAADNEMVPLASYFTGYRRRQAARRADQDDQDPAAASTWSPPSSKIAKRRFDDISSVGRGLRAALHDDGRVALVRIGLGGGGHAAARDGKPTARCSGGRGPARCRGVARELAGAGDADERPPGNRGLLVVAAATCCRSSTREPGADRRAGDL